MKTQNLLLLAICLIFCSCSKEGGETSTPPPPVKEAEKQLPITLALGIETRATDAAFEPGDQIGLYVVNYEGENPSELKTTGNYADNVDFTFIDGAWNPRTSLYWKDETTKADFYSFYPYAGLSDVHAVRFELKADQSTLTNYKSSDFLWGKTSGVSPTTSTVGIIVNHLFSNAIIKVEPGDGFTAESLAAANVSVSLGAIKTIAFINLATGTATATGNAQRVIPLKTDGIYTALVIPQTVSVANFITVKVNDKEYNLAKDFTFVANKRHPFTVKVSKTSSGIHVGIGNWETDEEDHGGEAV